MYDSKISVYNMVYGTCTCIQDRAVEMARYLRYIKILGRHNFSATGIS